MVEFFDAVMCLVAIVLIRAVFASFTVHVQLLSALVSATSASSWANCMRADFRLVSAKWPSAILVEVMEERASLQIMILRVGRTCVNLKRIEVEEHDALSLGNTASIGPLDVWAMLI